MIIYEEEKKLGLESQILSNASVAYTMPCLSDKDAAKANKNIDINQNITDLCQASSDDDDVYKVYSILVSTSWNKNDDIFTKEEVWASKDTPLYKPSNLEHDETAIVGNIIGNWPVDDTYNSLLEANLDTVPDFFHILVASVIYRQWQDPELKARAENLIQKVKDKEMYVSMECLFRGFDYAVLSPTQEQHIIARAEETAFLTKHLRAYGGTGEYQGHKIGRLLRNVTFSGKGFVERPANPDSVIFTDTNFDFTNASLTQDLFLNSTDTLKETHNMSDYLEGQVKDLKEALASVEAENKELTDKLSQANVEKLEATVAEMQELHETIKAEAADTQEKYQAAIAEVKKVSEELTSKSTELESIKAEMHKMEEEEKKKKRKEKLVEAGLSVEEAQEKSESLASLSDEQFAVVAETLFNLKPEVKEEEVVAEEAESEAQTEAEEITADEEVLETASEVEDVALSIAGESTDEKLGTVRANLQEWVTKRVLNKTGE